MDMSVANKSLKDDQLSQIFHRVWSNVGDQQLVANRLNFSKIRT